MLQEGEDQSLLTASSDPLLKPRKEQLESRRRQLQSAAQQMERDIQAFQREECLSADSNYQALLAHSLLLAENKHRLASLAAQRSTAKVNKLASLTTAAAAVHRDCKSLLASLSSSSKADSIIDACLEKIRTAMISEGCDNHFIQSDIQDLLDEQVPTQSIYTHLIKNQLNTTTTPTPTTSTTVSLLSSSTRITSETTPIIDRISKQLVDHFMRSQDNLERANASTRELANLESKLNVYFDHVKGNTGDAILFRNKLIDKSKAIAILTVHKYLMKTMASVEKSIASFTSTHHAERQETQLEKKMQQGYSTLLNMHETVSALSITNMDLIHRFQTRVDGNMEMASVTLAPAVHDSLKQLVEELKGDVADEGRCIVEGCKEMDRRGISLPKKDYEKILEILDIPIYLTPRNVLLEVSRILNTILEYRRLYQQQQPSTATLSATSAASTPLLKFDEIKMERLVNGVAVDVMYKMRKQDKEAREMALPYMQETVELAGRADSVYRDICSLDGEAQLLEEVKQRWIDLLT